MMERKPSPDTTGRKRSTHHGSQRTLESQVAHGSGRRRPGRLHRPGPRHGGNHGRPGCPRRRRAFLRSGKGKGVRARLRHPARSRLEKDQQKQAAWRTDPSRSGAAGCFGDIGTHAYNLGRFITGLLPDQISCTLKTFESGRQLDDYGTALIRYQNGALGTVTASQITHGRENDIWIEVDGTKGSLEWHQEEPNKMWFRVNGQPHRIYTRDPNASYMSGTGKASCRLPSGHPEAFLEAFANVYTAAYADMIARASRKKVDSSKSLYPNVADGVDGMNFITQSVASSKERGAWLSLKHPLCRA